VTTYHYSYAHGLKPKDIFIYNDKIWRCSKHKVQSLDPHKMMGHYWLEHAHSYYKNLPYKTREPDDSTGRKIKRSSNKWRMLEEKPVSKNPTLKKETPVGIVMRTSPTTLPDIPQHPPITAEAIVNAFEKRVIQIDAQLEAKDKLISQQATIIDAKNMALTSNESSRDELQRLKKQFEGSEATVTNQLIIIAQMQDELAVAKNNLSSAPAAKTDGLVGRLFKR